jgi:hypothetical protein
VRERRCKRTRRRIIRIRRRCEEEEEEEEEVPPPTGHSPLKPTAASHPTEVPVITA